ncbi:hypothetical protein QQE94_04525 [Fervidobacterium pennivorans subsp. shakshaketiis]|jgi:hypothetical protein|uniref:Transcriptional regulator n=1 Tax=Fervidobacterium pennivorans (strain DSM 9078 / Ven5) TaxID=771875 RepID=H9UC32_FERPD|nr:hypothetical protein [Fervidobacterium pennivorans]AFG35075.1 hypothetical protein Ferpe_0965 [Fervidobacterium pennivorans DSM 9078]QIV78517.1 hypothetical protein HER11_05930 [Fervidobacterium pennivorans subsp. keratinolyticus]
MRTNKRYVGKQKRQTEGASAKIALLVLGVILLVAGLYFGIKIMAVRNSPDFDLNKTSVYYFVYPVSTSNIETVVGRQITNKLFIVNGEKRTIYVIDIPPTIFINSKKLDATKASPRDFLTYFIDLLALKPDYSYVVYQKEEFFKKLKVRDMNQLVETYSKRGLKFLDYLSLQSQITALRPESAITEAALAKFYYSLGRFSIENVQIPLLTTMPIKITVDGNVYYRTYLDEEKLNELVSIFNK